MKQFILSLAMACVALAPTQAQTGKKVLAVGFYNVENLFNPENDPNKQDDDFTPEGDYHYTNEVYQAKLHNIASVMQQLATDVTPLGATIIGMAEVENDKVLKDLVAQPELKDRNYQFVWFPTPDVRGISTAMLYNPRFFRVINARPLYVPLETLGQSRPTRNITYVQGVFAGNDTVHVFVNHWPSRSSGVANTDKLRQLAAGVAKKVIDSLMQTNPNTKAIIMGDLNDNPTDASVLKVLKAKADTTDLQITDIYNPWINMFKKGIGTERFGDEWNLIDQIMVTGAFVANNNNKWKYHSNRIFRKDFLMHQSGENEGHPHRSFDINHHWDNGYSDHLPVAVFFVM